MRLLILFLLLLLHLRAEEIGTLLKAYELASDFSHKTKQESAGNLIVYTRDDLERMQVRTLKDLFKSLRFYHYIENRSGHPDILNQDPVMYSSMPVRIYLNDTELISAIFGSGTIWFGDMELDFIDHVEIYQGLPSFDIGVEPAGVAVRLYSKSVEHDRGGRIKLAGTRKKGNAENIYYTESVGGLSYFLYAGRYDDLREPYPLEDQMLSRDKKKRSFFAGFTTENHRLELFGLNQESDEFLGWSEVGAPEKAEGETDYYSASYHGTFLDKALALDLTYAWASNRFEHRYAEPWLLFLLTTYKSMEQINDESTLTANLKYHWKSDRNSLITGLQFRQKSLDLEKFSLDGQDRTLEGFFDSSLFFDRQDIYSAYLQEEYTPDEHQMLTLSMMQQRYAINNRNYRAFSPLQLRAGYIYTADQWYAKTFLAHQKFPPELYMMMQSYLGNPELREMSSDALTQEFAYDGEWGSARLLVAFARNKDFPHLVNGTLRNSGETVKSNSESLELTFRMRENDKLELQAFRVDQNAPKNGSAVLYHGGMLRMTNSFGACDLFNEVVVRSGYPTDDATYDYSAGLRYHATDDFSIDVKGENLLNEGAEWGYLYYDDYGTPRQLLVPTVDRRLWVGLEYLF